MEVCNFFLLKENSTLRSDRYQMYEENYYKELELKNIRESMKYENALISVWD